MVIVGTWDLFKTLTAEQVANGKFIIWEITNRIFIFTSFQYHLELKIGDISLEIQEFQKNFLEIRKISIEILK